MRLLIAYGTTEGQTRKITETIATQVAALGRDVEVFDTSGLPGGLRPETFDKIIIAGSVHEQRHQNDIELFVLGNLLKLQAKPTMFISVSLAAAFENSLPDAQSYVDSFVKDVGWQPGEVLLVAGAVRHGQYDYYQEQILEHVVLEDQDLEDPKGDHEFTDWQALAKAVDAFVGAAAETGNV